MPIVNNLIPINFLHLVRAGIEHDFNVFPLERILNDLSGIGILARKELPATLILRPFNFNTLAVRAYELASDERLADASLASLTIVAVGIVPVILLSRSIGRSRHEQTT